jgi:hypothetical protein
MTAPIASGWNKVARWDLHPLEKAAFARRTPLSVIQQLDPDVVCAFGIA